MPNSNDTGSQRGCLLLAIVLPLFCIGLTIASIYWAYEKMGVYGAVIVGAIFIAVLLLINTKSREFSAIKIYVHINPENRVSLNKFVKTLSMQKPKNKNHGVVRKELFKFIISDTSKRFQILNRNKRLLAPEILDELNSYINLASRQNDYKSLEELNKVRELIEVSMKTSVKNAFLGLGMTVVRNLNEDTRSQTIRFKEYTRNSKSEPRANDKISTAEWTQIECPKCRNFYLDYVWLLIDIYERPDLFAQLPNIHVFTCPYCDHKYKLAGGVVAIHFYPNRSNPRDPDNLPHETLPPIIIRTEDNQKNEESTQGKMYWEKVLITLAEKIPSSYSPLRHAFRTMHRYLAYQNIIQESQWFEINAFSEKHSKEFSDWLANVILDLATIESAMLFLSGVVKSVPNLRDHTPQGVEIITPSVKIIFNDPRSITLKITKIACQVAGVLAGAYLFAKMPLNPSFLDGIKTGLQSGAILGFIACVISLIIGPAAISIEAGIRKITLPIDRNFFDIQSLLLFLLSILLGGLIGLCFGLLTLGIISLLPNQFPSTIFLYVMGAILGFVVSLPLRDPRLISIAKIKARHRTMIYF